MAKNRLLIIFVTFLCPFIFFGQSIQLDIALGAENARMVESSMGLYDNVDMTNYLRKIGKRLVSQLDNPLFEYKFNLITDKTPNAFALPGGYLYVTTGLIPILKSEDELACILGHEIIHSNNRHSVKQLKKSILPKLLEIPGNLLGVVNKDLGEFFNAPIETSNELLFASYGRKFETEADDEGIRLAAKAGYDPNAMITSLERLSKTLEIATNTAEKKSYFNDHPYTPDRTKAIEAVISELHWKREDPLSDNFLGEFDGVLFGDSPKMGQINDNQFLHPDLDFFIEFPTSWIIDNQPTKIGAYQPSQKAAAFVTIESNGFSPRKASQHFIANMDKNYSSKMTEEGVVNIGEREGYLLTFTEIIESQTVFAYVLWIPLEDKLFKFVGIGPIEYKVALEKIATSLRKLNKKDRDALKIDLLRIVEAKQGETIETLSKRVENKLNINLTCVINSIEMDEELTKGRPIKVVIQHRYK